MKIRCALCAALLGFRQFLWSVLHGDVVGYRGTRVLVVTPDWYMREHLPATEPSVVRCRVSTRGTFRDTDIVFARRVHKSKKAREIEAVRFVDRGVTWCFGWRDEDEKVLHALAALENSR